MGLLYGYLGYDYRRIRLLAPVLWVRANAVSYAETSLEEPLYKIPYCKIRGESSSDWTGNASVPGAFSAERWLALLPDCVENLPNWPNVQVLSYHSPLNYFEIAQSAYSIETIFYRCTHSYRNCLFSVIPNDAYSGDASPYLCGPLYHPFPFNARIEDSVWIVPDAAL